MVDKIDYDTVHRDNFVLTGKLSAPEVYADGLTQVAIFGSIAKMLLHSVAWPKTSESPEVRKAVQYISMPVVNAIEFAHFVLQAAKDSEVRLLKTLDNEQSIKVKRILDQINPSLSKNDIQKTDNSPAKKKQRQE